MDTMSYKNPMEKPPPLAGLDPADLLRQGAADDTFVDGAPSAFNPPPLEELAAVFPQFQILELIGQGGMGAVYKVRQKDLDRIVALKILPPRIGQSPEFSNRFTREARALAKLNHPGIVTLHEFGQQNGLYFILMEFVDGVNLAQLMKTGRISPREALAIVPQICDALQYAHDQGIVHRDIKPENLLLDRQGRVKVADFGIAKVVAAVCDRRTDEDDEVRRSQTDATLVGKIIGTPQYMAPEQIEHPSDVDHRADIYALGVVFYQMLTGELPGKELQAPSRKVQIDVRLDEIVLKAMEKNPELRYQQASVMRTRVDDLQAVIPQNEPSKNGTSIPNEKENRTEPFAITSLILGICSLILWPLAALPAIVFGHLARGRIRKNPALKGNGFAIAGLSLGYFFLTVSIVGIIVLALFFNLRSLAIRDEYDPQSAYSARAKASPEAMAEPPKLRFIGLPHPSKERWHPDGTLVTDPHELALMREIGPIYAGGMSKGESIRGMEFWFSHPLLESWHITEVEFLDESGIVAARLGGINGKNKETFGEEGRLNWPIKITPVDISKPLNVRLNYTMGPLERVQEHRVEQNSSGSSFSDGNTRVANWGQTAGGQAFLALSEDKDTQNKHRFGVEAVTKDGAIIQHGSWYSSGSAHTTNITFEFGVPISEVAKFRIGTRRLRSVVWKNVAVSAKNTVPVENETNAVNISGNHPEKKLAEYDWKILAENGRTSDGVPQTLDGRTVLKIENLKDSPMQAHLLTIEKPPIGAMKYALSGEIRYENVQGLAYLEMWSVFPNGRYFSRTKGKSGSGPMSQLAGTSAWREFTLPFDRTGTADAPTRIEVNLFLPGRGVVFMGPLKMIEYGLGKEATDGAETPQTSRSEDAKAQVGDMALPWLAGIDAGDYARSWKDAAEFFQKAVTSEKWSEALTTFRKPLGAVKSRKMRDMKEANTLPGAPDGKYWVMQFDTSFDAKAEAVETVTFMLEKDGAWKAAGYFIR